MKAKRVLSLALAVTLCAGLLTMSALAAGDFVITDGVLTKYNGPGGDVVIPQGVVAIGEKAFQKCESLTSITIPNGVTVIGDDAFSECSNLTRVSIPQSVTTIGEWAFDSCYSLTNITIPYGVTTIESGTFRHCINLVSITIPDSVTTIGDLVTNRKYTYGAFDTCSNLTSITIPDSVTTIGQSTFSGCGSLTNITIPDSVTIIDYGAFSNCDGLTSVTIPDSVTIIGEYAFFRCSNLSSVTLGKGLTTIYSDAFTDCSLTSITIPPEVTATSNLRISSDGKICGAPGSWAELWAQDEGYKFVADRPFATTPSRTAYATPQTVNVDGKSVTFQCYAKKDEKGNLTNYVKLRDLAYVLNGTQAQFQVGYSDNQVTATTKTPYTANGSEMSAPFSGNRTYLDGSSYLQVDGSYERADSFVLRDDNGGGYTYYKLRDLGQLLGFNVGWSADKGVYVETNKPYDPNN